eukprot:TRINITY_DN5305_c0_g1_i2.p1 TRINITY_DN5305_c0_g1~~TRINITY_DN5305_c0_g1_i2.p1  ORF type:complete len:331 (-),score=68.28 TRINITY_DN5305_c0_g1_i2:75-1067(-)
MRIGARRIMSNNLVGIAVLICLQAIACEAGRDAFARHNISAPLKVVYIDWQDVNWNDPASNVKQIADAGYNVIILGFYLTDGPTDMAQAWSSASASSRAAAVSYVHAKGGAVLVSAGGSTGDPYAVDPTTYGTRVAAWAMSNSLDGVDFDLENFQPGLLTPSGADGIAWATAASIAARQVLGPNGIITHAPQAPYFGAIGSSAPNPGTRTGGGYSAIWAKSGGAISWFNVQFYNQGSDCYNTYSGLFSSSGIGGKCWATGTSLNEIVSYGVPSGVMAVGKLTTASDGDNGYVDPTTLGQWFKTANFKTGVMVWDWHASGSQAWIEAVYPS